MRIADWKIGTRLAAGYALLLLLLAAVALMGMQGLRQSNAAMHHVVDVNAKKISLLEEMASAIHVVSRVVRTVALLQDPAQERIEHTKIDVARRKYDAAFADLAKMPLDQTGKAFVAAIAEDAKQARTLNDRYAALAHGERSVAVQFLLQQAAPATARWQDALHGFIVLQDRKNLEDEARAGAAYETAMTWMLTLSGAALLLGSMCGWIITRSITRPIARAVQIAQSVASGDLTVDIVVVACDETGQLLAALKSMTDSLVNIVGQVRVGTETIAHAAGEIATGNLDLSTRTEQQAASLEETASAMEELTSTVKQNAGNASQANALADKATDVASRGGTIVQQVVSTMGSINDSSRKIADIIGVIDGIAFQTNILALNAAVEAARAGEQGRGFAVVASEVRNLSHRSAAAAKEIKELIADSVGKVDAGSRLVGEAGTTMDSVVDSVKRVATMVAEISAANDEQSIGIEQVNEAIIRIDETTQQNAALVEQAAAATASMQEQSDRLVQLVSIFKCATPARLVALAGIRPARPALQSL
ncbi:methyl-accepting chemotaxis protein [Massilia sp. S19_KUP03_FR1]|uniref:methyl-accepting chemotaxis protein n=1 Tax=Massilia sp. S19_KUP03_FR1 TaxID=3025503 RepID=UPI002FCDA95F